jgi:imidazole glycerol-phosphate synthase subunit HisH
MIDILDVGSGNLKSLKNWIEKASIPCRYVDNPADIKSGLIVLPGVGSVGPYMSRFREKGFDKAVIGHIGGGGRVLGICLGFQILGGYSEEDGGVECLNILDGHVERIQSCDSHNGWELISLNKKKLNNQSFSSQYQLTRKQKIEGRVFYNHEYGFVNKDADTFDLRISKELDRYSGLIIKDKIIGIQFHPEKSQLSGHELISMIL